MVHQLASFLSEDSRGYASWTTGPLHELFSARLKALEKFDQGAPFLSAQRFADVFHDQRVLPKCFLDKLPPRCSEADYTGFSDRSDARNAGPGLEFLDIPSCRLTPVFGADEIKGAQ